MTVVFGTAGHIDHGKTTLLRALTGIDADRLPEERRRGMTIDVGYAHMTLDDGSEIDFVDVPGHDKLVGNMLVGAGEIDAAVLVVAADDGPRAQTLEHLALLDALAIRDGLAVVTKVDVVAADRVGAVVDEVEALLAGTALAGAPIVTASGTTGEGLPAIRAAIDIVRGRVAARTAGAGRPATLAIDRVFSVKGRGIVVTGTLRGGRLSRGDVLRSVPGDAEARVREIQVHGTSVVTAGPGRVALNLAGIGHDALHRGVVLTADTEVAETSRVAVALWRPLPDRSRGRLHLGTAATDVAVGRSGHDAIDLDDGRAVAMLRLTDTIAARPGDRFVIRRSGGTDPIVGGVVLDPEPPRGVSRRRGTPARLAATVTAVSGDDPVAIRAARLDRHGVLVEAETVGLAPDVAAVAAALAADVVAPEATSSVVRNAIGRAIRRVATVRRDDLATVTAATLDGLVRAGRLVRAGDLVRPPGASTSTASALDPALAAAMDRLERALSGPMPPPLSEAARASACPPAGVRDLERAGRIVVLAPDLAYAAGTYRDLTSTAVTMAGRAPLTPAAYRDATGTSRKYVMAILEDLDRRGVLRRTPDGHVPGPRAATVAGGPVR